MKKAKYTYLDEQMTKEVGELLKGPHGGALRLYSLEVAYDAIKDYKRGQRCAITKTGLLIGLAAGMYYGGKTVYERAKKNKECTGYWY